MKTLKTLLLISSVFSLLNACNRNLIQGADTPFPTIAIQPSTTIVTTLTNTPQPTQEPMAVVINGVGITQKEFQAELLRFKQANQANKVTLDDKIINKIVLDELIKQELLAQYAKQNGYTVDEAVLKQKQTKVMHDIGGEEAFNAWKENYHYNMHDFNKTLERQIAAAWARDKIASSVPNHAYQVHARQIFTYDENTAQNAYMRLNNGESFDTLAYEFDPLSGGDLGWFPQGYLLEEELDHAIFANENANSRMQPNQISGVLKTRLGYHIIQIIETEEERIVTEEVKLKAQQDAVKRQLQILLKDSQIQNFIQ